MHKAMIKELARLMLAATLAIAGTAGSAQFATTGTAATACAGDVTIESTGVVKCTEGGTTLLPSCSGDIVIDTTGAIRCSSTVSASAPKCTLAASPTSVAAGGSSTLTATCSPAATSYAWTLGNGSTQTTTTNKLSVKPTSTSTYTVKGANTAGQGAAASATVTVGGATTGVPVCSLSVSAGFSVGQILVQASCNPAATSYTWTNTGFASTASSGYLLTPTTTTTYSVIGRNAYGSSTQKSATWTVSKPNCTLTAAPSSIGPGGTSILTASCSPAASSFAWTGGTCAANTTNSCSVTLASGSQTYSVTGTNTGGTSTAASATVTVTKPSCTLSASAPSIAPGGTSTLTASCSPAADVNGYTWTGGTCAGTTTNSCTVTLATGSQAYTVTGSNAVGISNPPASATVTVAPPSCTLTAAPSSIAPNASSTLTANCSPAATSIAWTGGTCAGNTTTSCNVTLASGSQTYTVTGTNLAGSGSPASATVTVIVPGTCTLANTNMPIAWGKDFGKNYNIKMSRGQSVSIEFTTPPLNYWGYGTLTRVAGAACTGTGSVAGSLYCNGSTWITPVAGAACTGTGTAEGLTCTAGFWATNVTPVQGAACTEAGNATASGALYCNGATWVKPVLYTACTGSGAAGGYTCSTGWRASMVKEVSTVGTMVPTHLHVSPTQCDFTYPTNWTTAWDGCSQADAITSLQYKVEATDSHTFGVCSLRPNTKYYANFRNEDAVNTANHGIDTCPAGTTCGYVFQMH